MSEQVTLSFLIGLAVGLSGWASFVYNYITGNPKIDCKIINIIVGQMNNPELSKKPLTSFMTYLYLVNKRKNTIHILDYEMEAEKKGEFQRLFRVYGTSNMKNWTFSDANKEKIEIPDLEKKWIYSKESPVQYGVPLHGFVLFAGDDSFFNPKPERFRITIIDAFKKKHQFIAQSKDFTNLFLFADIAGIKLPTQFSAPIEKK